MQIKKPICESCKNIKNNKPGYFCKAFPQGIPDEILTGGNEHTKPLKDQGNNIVFEAK